MPELPEVETVRRTLEPLLVGKRIDRVDVFYSKIIKSELSSFASSLEGREFIEIKRYGKFLVFLFDDDLAMISHLRMEGKYRLEKGEGKARKHDLVAFHLSSDETLFYNDVRKFGILCLLRKEELFAKEPLNKLGKEPFDITEEELLNGLKKKKNAAIKEALLDQSLISGIGNIYADEILIHSGINPLRKASSITLEETNRILENARNILSLAISEGGSTVRSYHPSEGKSGKMQLSLWAYGHEGKPCPICGLRLKKIRVGGRGTTYCPHCEPSFEEPYVVGVTGPIASGKSTVSKYLESKGYRRLDADAIVASLYSKKSFQRKLIAIFGNEIIKNDEIDRKKLLDFVSSSLESKKKLDDLVHPMVYSEIEKEIAKSKDKKIVLDVPLLIDSPLERLCDAIVLVYAKKDIQRKRIIERGKDPEKSLSLNSSFPLEKAKLKASLIIETDDSPIEETLKKIDDCKFLD